MAAPLNEATVSGLAAGSSGNGNKAVVVAKPEDLRNHRLIVMFFDLTSMQPEDLDRSVAAAQAVSAHEDAARRPGGAGLAGRHAQGGPGLYRRQECARSTRWASTTAPKGRALRRALTRIQTRWKTPPATRPTRANTTTSIPTANSSRCGLSAKSLEKITEKKSLLYFSGGISRDGIENQASLRAAINAAVRANLAIYSVDTRGLQAITSAGRRLDRQPARNRRLHRRRAANNMKANFATQEVMAHALDRHRRQGVFRFQRFCSRLCAGAARYICLLRAWLSKLESGARRQISQADHQGRTGPE